MWLYSCLKHLASFQTALALECLAIVGHVKTLATWDSMQPWDLSYIRGWCHVDDEVATPGQGKRVSWRLNRPSNEKTVAQWRSMCMDEITTQQWVDLSTLVCKYTECVCVCVCCARDCELLWVFVHVCLYTCVCACVHEQNQHIKKAHRMCVLVHVCLHVCVHMYRISMFTRCEGLSLSLSLSPWVCKRN